MNSSATTFEFAKIVHKENVVLMKRLRLSGVQIGDVDEIVKKIFYSSKNKNRNKSRII